MTTHAVATAVTLYRTGTFTLEQAATASGCSPEQLRSSARVLVPPSAEDRPTTSGDQIPSSVPIPDPAHYPTDR